jgi:UDP-2,3-diacylglucosamine hydrolase
MKTFRCFVFSDLHINARGSRVAEIALRLIEEIENADIIQLNGDIIEMFYPEHLNQHKRVFNAYTAAAKDGANWLKSIIEKYPEKQFLYLEGNHENCDIFRENIYALREQFPNLTWGRTYMQIGNGHFFHGDNETRNTEVEKRERGQVKDIISGKLWERMNITAELPVMGLMRKWNTDKKVIKKIYNFLQKLHPERLEKSDHIFFGHTHLPFLAMQRHEMMWHNTGSATKFGKDNFLTFDLNVPGDCAFNTDDKRVFYPDAKIENVKRVDMGGRFSEAINTSRDFAKHWTR